ncbi:MAG: FAD-binding oxidoreductase [Gammaproteobacteria bacterium]|nr:FAD-binding oxidoreductase [Gammaproteobacteria bacterium]
MEYDVIVIGGGLVGSSIAYGLSKQKLKTLVLDGGDQSFRASRGNFGLVWVQGKGWNYAPYARWCQQAADLWPEFNQELQDVSSATLDYQRTGGFHFCLDETEWEQRQKMLAAVNRHTEGQFEYDMIDRIRLKKMIPQISNKVIGGSFSGQDGHVDPLALLHALFTGMNQQGVDYLASQSVNLIERRDNGYLVKTNKGMFSSEKLVLCAGLGNQKLGPMVGLEVPVIVERGQVMITERMKPFLEWPTLHVRQTGAGTIQIGDSHEDVGFNDGTDPYVLKKIAQRAVSMFPFLESVKVVRAWGALRILTPDHNPIYQQSSAYPGAFAVTCHSGVTLAAAHAGPVANWISGKDQPSDINQFSADRFNV